MEAHNARTLDFAPDLDVHGAELRVKQTQVVDFCDEASVTEVYYQECRDMILDKYPAAVKVVVLDHNIRHQTLAGLPIVGQDSVALPNDVATYNPPVLHTHNDWSDVSAPQRMRGLTNGNEEASPSSGVDCLATGKLEELLRTCDYSFVNIWRSVGREPVQDRHLAFIDARTLDECSVVRSDELYGDGIGAVCFFEPSKNHSWLYWDRMTPSEVMLLKCYDSRHRENSSRDKFCRFTAHAAFVDDTAPPTAAPRQSIEVRMAVFLPREPQAGKT